MSSFVSLEDIYVIFVYYVLDLFLVLKIFFKYLNE